MGQPIASNVAAGREVFEVWVSPELAETTQGICDITEDSRWRWKGASTVQAMIRGSTATMYQSLSSKEELTRKQLELRAMKLRQPHKI